MAGWQFLTRLQENILFGLPYNEERYRKGGNMIYSLTFILAQRGGFSALSVCSDKGP